MKDYNLKSLKDLKFFSKKMFALQINLFLLSGDLGAGKTTFVSAFIEENLLDASESFESLGVMSPTFSLINSYQTKTKSIVHADLYRLEKSNFEEEELIEMIDDADYSFVEWPSKFQNIETLKKSFKTAVLNFKINKDQTRSVLVTLP